MSIVSIYQSAVFWYVVQGTTSGITKPVDKNYRTFTFTKNVLEPFFASTGTDTYDIADVIYDNFEAMMTDTCETARRYKEIQRHFKEFAIGATAVSVSVGSGVVKIMFYWY